jgi:hypothetical protein
MRKGEPRGAEFESPAGAFYLPDLVAHQERVRRRRTTRMVGFSRNRPTIRVVPLRGTCYWWATYDTHGSEDPWHRTALWATREHCREADSNAGV